MPPKPSIVSPVARTIRVSDQARASTFYQDILGFEIRDQAGATEAVSGPVRLTFGRVSTPPVIFLQTDDVKAFRKAIQTRGGKPGKIQKVNWIKMNMFEIRDPDGNVLWFGQTYHKQTDSPSRRPGQPAGMRQALPEVPFNDVPAAVAYYRDVLRFHINYQQEGLGVMDRDAITVLLIPRTKRHKGIGSFEVYVEDADALYAELSKKGANVQGEPVSHPWGLRDFCVLDPEGNRITFAQTFE